MIPTWGGPPPSPDDPGGALGPHTRHTVARLRRIVQASDAAREFALRRGVRIANPHVNQLRQLLEEASDPQLLRLDAVSRAGAGTGLAALTDGRSAGLSPGLIAAQLAFRWDRIGMELDAGLELMRRANLDPNSETWPPEPDSAE